METLTPKQHVMINNSQPIQDIINALDCELIPSQQACINIKTQDAVNAWFANLPPVPETNNTPAA